MSFSVVNKETETLVSCLKMLVEHFRRDFMDLVLGQRVVLIAHQDVDSVCSVKILTNLFKTEGVAYILLSCNGISDLKTKYDEFATQASIFILVNCGATIDLLDTLENPPPDKKFFIMDYHRPIHIINYYNTSGQVRLVSIPEQDEKVPEFDQIFAEEPDISDDSDSEDDMDDDVDENGETARMRRRADRAKSRRKHNEWLEQRERILFDYREYSYYARPSALYALEIAWVMSRDDMESIWCTIIALTDALVSSRLSRGKYTEYASTVNDHILRITNAEKLPRDCLKIRFERELFLFLYRNWSIYESAKVTPYVANSLKTWSMEGCRRFHQMLAHLGLPLVEVKQKYLSMSMDLRKQLIEMFSGETAINKFKLPDMVFGSFVAEIGFRPKFNALDAQLATLAVMEDPDPSKTCENKFLEAMQVLNVRDLDVYKHGIEKAKGMLKLLVSQVQMMVDARHMQEVGPFVFVQLSDTLIEYNYFKRPASIPLLVHFLQHAGIRAGKRKWRQCPWVIMIPYSSEYFIAVGVQPGAYDHDEKNIFFEVFRVLKAKLADDVMLDYFDGWAILVKTAQRQSFINQLLAVSE